MYEVPDLNDWKDITDAAFGKIERPMEHNHNSAWEVDRIRYSKALMKQAWLMGMSGFLLLHFAQKENAAEATLGDLFRLNCLFSD